MSLERKLKTKRLNIFQTVIKNDIKNINVRKKTCNLDNFWFYDWIFIGSNLIIFDFMIEFELREVLMITRSFFQQVKIVNKVIYVIVMHACINKIMNPNTKLHCFG